MLPLRLWILSILLVNYSTATQHFQEASSSRHLSTQFYHGKHVRPDTSWHSHQHHDEDDYSHSDISTSDSSEEDNNSTSSHQSDSDEDVYRDDHDHDNDFPPHGIRKHTKKSDRFVWYPFTPKFLINPDPYAPISPHVMSKWSRKANDLLLVVVQQLPASTSAPSTSATSCQCENQTWSSGDLHKERNGSAAELEPHLTDWPSSCVWAIVACCAPNNYHFRFGCFTYLGCSIAFWDTEPCQLDIMTEASRQAFSYYYQFGYVGGGDHPHPDNEQHPGQGEGQNTTNSNTPTAPSPSPSPPPSTPPSTISTTSIPTSTTQATVTTTTEASLPATTTSQTATTT